MSNRIVIVAIIGIVVMVLGIQVLTGMKYQADLEGRKISTVTTTREAAEFSTMPRTVTVETVEYKEQK